MNDDGFIDVLFRRERVARDPARPWRRHVQRPHALVAPTTAFTDEVRIWAHVVDLDGDGHRDIIVPEPMDTLKFYRGNGDFTFKPAVDLLHARRRLSAGRGDQRRLQRRRTARSRGGQSGERSTSSSIRGGTTFDRSVIDGWPFTDITTRDLNNDGRLDLVASSGRWDLFETVGRSRHGVRHARQRQRHVPEPLSRYETGVFGTMSVVVGDFNGDGKSGRRDRQPLDHGRRSDSGCMLWDSVTILPGDGTGRLLAPTDASCFGSVAPEFGARRPRRAVSGTAPSAQHVGSERRRPHRSDWVARCDPPQSAGGAESSAGRRSPEPIAPSSPTTCQHRPARSGRRIPTTTG